MSQSQREVIGLEKHGVRAVPYQPVLYWQYRAGTNSSWPAMVWMQHVITSLRNVLALLGLSTLGPFFYFIYLRKLFKTWVREQCSGNGISRICVSWNAFSAQAKQWNRWNPKLSWWLLISSGISVPVPSILEMAGLRNVTFFFQSKISRDFCSVL